MGIIGLVCVIGLSLFLGYSIGFRRGLEKGETIGYSVAKSKYDKPKRFFKKPSISDKDKESLVWMG